MERLLSILRDILSGRLSPELNRKSYLPRVWSNGQLRRVGALFDGLVVNVSAGRDEDKQGGHYRDYFPNAAGYRITNYGEEGWGGLRGDEDELFLDLIAPLPDELRGAFDVVFNHTTLEHIYEVHAAFANLCAMSRDVVILVVPFLQEMHCPPEGGDYWRFTPQTLRRLFAEHGFTLLQCTFNSHPGAAVYLFAVASRQPGRWPQLVWPFDCHDPRPTGDSGFGLVGCHAIQNPFAGLRRLARRLRGRADREPVG